MKLRFRLWPALLLLLLASADGTAHIGSPEIFYEGMAGPYKVLVSIRPPDVVPGVAEINVRVDQGDVRRVTVQPIYFQTGGDGAPSPEEARRAAGDQRYFSGSLWLMEFGSSSVSISVEGDHESGTALVPVPAIATARRKVDWGLGVLLAGFGLFLFAGAISVIGASVRESMLAPGDEVQPRNRKRARRVMALTAAMITIALVLGNSWWASIDSRYLRNMFKPLRLNGVTRVEGDRRVLKLSIDDPGWLNREIDDLVPDHGKLMHMFLVREPDLDGFAHLHPVKLGSQTFESLLPALPQGRYRIYADVVHEDGLTETLVAATDIPASPGTGQYAGASDPDDSWLVKNPVRETSQQLPDGSTITWEREAAGALRSGRVESLRFSVKGPDGKPASLEPYMGMRGHAAILRDDGAVFVHVHPVGTISMAAQQAFIERIEKDKLESGSPAPKTTGHADHMSHAANSTPAVQTRAAGDDAPPDAAGAISFPYSFPEPGRYLVWVQFKREGRVLTAPFEANVL